MKKKNTLTLMLAAVALLAAVAAAACSSSPAAPLADASSFPTAEGFTPTVEASVPDGPLAPDFALTSATGQSVSLADLLDGREATVIVFYRGFF